MKQYTKDKINFLPGSRAFARDAARVARNSVPKITIDDKLQLKRLAKHSKFTYDFKFNQKRTKVKLSLSTVDVLNNQLGVYADQHIKASHSTIGCYAGKRVRVGKESDDSYYIFEISNREDEIIEFIDGEKLRDWTNFVNHSVTPNLDVYQRKINGKVNICFYVARPIRKGEQLLFDYGRTYFTSLKNYYIHASDSWKTAAEHYMEKQQFYLTGTYVFDNQLKKDLLLKNVEWLIPTIFLTIYHNDSRRLKSQLKNHYPLDLLAYALTAKHKIATRPFQEHLTALMIACYLGHEECIDILLQHRPDVNRCMLTAGYSAFVLLCKGRGKATVIDRVGKKLLKSMHFPLIIDRDKKSILHYAIKCGDAELVKQILHMLKREDDDKALTKVLHKDDILYCLKHRYVEMLGLLLKAQPQDDFPISRIISKYLNNLKNIERKRWQKMLAHLNV